MEKEIQCPGCGDLIDDTHKPKQCFKCGTALSVAWKDDEELAETYLTPSWISIFFNPPLGALAIYFAKETEKYNQTMQYAKARTSSRLALGFMLAAYVAGIIVFFVLRIPMK